MKKLLIWAMVSAILAGYFIAGIPSARADDAWKGPGWYVVAYQYAVILWSGPYTTRDACERAKPVENDPPGFSYSCSWFDRNPD
jgi:hypothetical protein